MERPAIQLNVGGASTALSEREVFALAGIASGLSDAEIANSSGATIGAVRY